jgi:hypothetical protein
MVRRQQCFKPHKEFPSALDPDARFDCHTFREALKSCSSHTDGDGRLGDKRNGRLFKNSTLAIDNPCGA